MDHRQALKAGAVLPFPGMACRVEAEVGRGSNSLVYAGSYQDAAQPGQGHRVLIKELFPFDYQGHIWRNGAGELCRDAQGEETWALHRLSFERGNAIHLRLLAQRPDQIGGNLNTYSLNGTLYTLLDYSGGRSMDSDEERARQPDLPLLIRRMRKILLALDTFHQQGFLHLDISLDNVLLIGRGEQERVMLIDYNSVHTRQELLTGQAVYFSAKEGFTAPEVRTGMNRSIGPWTDLFSVAAIFYAGLTGRPPTLLQLNRKAPPDAGDSPLLSGALPTVREQARRILRRGLTVLPEKRYQRCGDMLRDLEELQRRLEGVGVTHAALWEAGRRSVQRLVRQNPSLDYVQREAELYPLRVRTEEGVSLPAGRFVQNMASGQGGSALLLGAGGMGKSTALLRAALTAPGQYSPAAPAILYLPLLGWKQGERNALLNRILAELKFDESTPTMEDARHALTALLSKSIPGKEGAGRPTLLLLLDGLNEAAGDTAALLEEIKGLAALPGVRLLIAGRTAPEGLALPRASMIPLEQEEIRRALAAHGLLPPENPAMAQLLQTPMMLSLFIRTAGGLNAQVQCQNEKELLDCYLAALCQKATRDAEQAARFQTEAAVYLVLPAVAEELTRQGQPLTDRALLRVCARCRKILRSRAMSRAFPQWIGHRQEILGDATADAWYGRMVQEILWRGLGLLVRDGLGRYHLLHQIVQEYLLALQRENGRRLHAQRLRMSVLAAVAVLLLAGGGAGAYEVWFRPRPYDPLLCQRALDAALMQYDNCGQQYDAMIRLLEGRMTGEQSLRLVSAHGAAPARSVTVALDTLRQSGGQVVPWSGRPLDFDRCEALLALPAARAPDYSACIRAYQLIQARESATPEEEFSYRVRELAEADADIAWLLDRMVSGPHLDTMPAEQKALYDAALLNLPAAQETRTIDTERGIEYALEKAYARRQDAKNALQGMAVMHDERVGEMQETAAP